LEVAALRTSDFNDVKLWRRNWIRSPDYVSGHSTFSAAAATVLARFWNADSVPFATTSDFLPGVLRHFSLVLRRRGRRR
jgi:hypothetical protein